MWGAKLKTSDLSWLLQHGLNSLGNSNYMLNDTNNNNKKVNKKHFLSLKVLQSRNRERWLDKKRQLCVSRGLW